MLPIVVVLSAVAMFTGCAGGGNTAASARPGGSVPAPPASSAFSPSSASSAPSVSSTTSSSVPSTTSSTVNRPARFSGTIDVAAYAGHKAGWFTAPMTDLPATEGAPEGTFVIAGQPIDNRRAGAISPTLISSYLFVQFGEIKAADLAKRAGTLNALFIRSALIGFVDYQGGKVFDWDKKSSRIPVEVVALIREANKEDLPVFLELNYTDYIPGPIGTGTRGLVRADNIARTVSFLKTLQKAGLQIQGVTFGDEIGDDSGYGAFKPTLESDDIVARFAAYATALRQAFPSLKIFAFDSYIAATRGQVSDWFALLRQVREAEMAAGVSLIDGFMFRESYVYMDEDGKVLGSQDILDDVESLAGWREVTRYDVYGNRNNKPDRAYLPELVKQTQDIFGRTIDLGITEYLPAGPVQISESDTSKYADIDFIIHYADLVGVYAEQGLDVVSTWMFANTVDDSKCYVDKRGDQGLNYPVHEQLAQHFRGSLLAVERPQPYEPFKVKVYAARNDTETFLMVLNKDVSAEHIVRVVLAGEYDLVLRLAPRSYTSLVLKDGEVTVSGVGA